MGNLLMVSYFKAAVIFFALIFSIDSWAQESAWSSNASLNILKGSYGGATNKGDLTAFGIKTSTQYLDRFNLSLGFSNLSVTYKDVILADENSLLESDFELSQDEFVFDISASFFSDLVNGKLTPGIQYQSLEGDLADPLLGDLEVLGGYFKYTNHSQSFYWDIHASFSNYDQNIKILQQDFSVGTTILGSSNWLQARVTYIDTSPIKELFPVNIGTSTKYRKESYLMLDLFYKRWLSSYQSWVPEAFFVAASVGDSLLAVDPTSQVTWNLLEIRTGYYRMGLNWLPFSNIDLTIMVSHSEFELLNDSDRYDSTNIYLSISRKW